MHLFNLVQGNMVRKKHRPQHKWNISKKRGNELIHKHILDIFGQKGCDKVALQELIALMNQSTNHIHLIQNKQKKSISTYVTSVYGSFTNFLDEYSMYGIIREDKIYICLFEVNMDPSIPFDRLSDWQVINEEDYVLI